MRDDNVCAGEIQQYYRIRDQKGIEYQPQITYQEIRQTSLDQMNSDNKVE